MNENMTSNFAAIKDKAMTLSAEMAWEIAKISPNDTSQKPLKEIIINLRKNMEDTFPVIQQFILAPKSQSSQHSNIKKGKSNQKLKNPTRKKNTKKRGKQEEDASSDSAQPVLVNLFIN